MSEEKKPFNVRDRRLFTPDGNPRASDGEPEVASERATGLPADPALPASESRSAAEPPTFEELLFGLWASAALSLGLMRLPDQSQEPKLDLIAARHSIGMLEILQDKTEGRRTPEEDRLLSQFLYELRMAYVAKSRGGAA